MTRFLCIGDLHIGAGPDYGREPGDRLRDQEAVWARALELAAEHQVDAVLFAGDAFHRHTRTPAELRAFQRPLEAFAAEHAIEILGIPGNHDVESSSASCVLEVFGRDIDMHFEPGIWRAPDRVEQKMSEIATVATLPWTPVSRLVAARGGGDRDDVHAVAAQLLVETARDLRAQIDGPAVLMLHWSVSGASTPTGVMTDEFRETVIPLADLETLGYDAIVCGHIHRAQVLNATTPEYDGFIAASTFLNGGPIFYTGSPAPVDFGEAATPHGVWLLDVGDGPTTIDFLPIESRPFVTLDVDFTDGQDFSMLYEQYGDWSDVQDAVVRVRYTASEEDARHVDHGKVTRALYAVGASKVYSIQPNILRENRARVDHVNEDIAPLAAVDAWVTANEISTEHSAALVELTSRYLQEVGTA